MIQLLTQTMGSLANGVLLYFVWPWFLVPLGAQPLPSIWHAWGLAVIASGITSDRMANWIQDRFENTDDTADHLVLAGTCAVVFPIAAAVSLGFLWVIAWFGGLL